MSDIKEFAKKIEDIADDLSRYYALRSNLVAFANSLKGLSSREVAKKKKEFLKGKSEEEWLSFYDDYIKQQLSEIKSVNESILSLLTGASSKKPVVSDIKKQVIPIESSQGAPSAQQVRQDLIPNPVVPTKKFISLDKKTKNRYIKEYNIEVDYLRSIVPSEVSNKKVILEDYSIYKSNPYGNISNTIFEDISLKLSRNYPQFFDNLRHNLRAADIKILSKTYVSMMLFTSLLAFFVSFFLGFILVSDVLVFKIVVGLLIALGSTFGVFMFMYLYPAMVANSRKKRIKDDLPFVVLHMAAVAGSGAQPIAMFNLILSSGEYKGVEGEIKKIVNYVNLFGYNLTTALRAVSLTTPSSDLKDLLNGLVTTIESGGDLKSFLNAKADEVMTNYKLERKKYVETLGTYSDIYTGVLIAAPLLFFITLAIIRMFGTDFMGVSIATIASFGTYGLIPLLNIGFIIFLNMVQPST
ncbi:MAG: type II secretion system F family protein [Candidatus Nanoarchaeia archaeon]